MARRFAEIRSSAKASKPGFEKANRILAKQARPSQRKLEQKSATEKKVKAVLRQNRQN